MVHNSAPGTTKNANNANTPTNLGTLLHDARERLGLSKLEVARRSGVPDSSIYRIEQGILSQPRPATLKALASVLELELADVHAAAGYGQPDALPTFAPYLRSKYGDLPPKAQAELERAFTRIAKKHGYDPSGPKPGEDEG